MQPRLRERRRTLTRAALSDAAMAMLTEGGLDAVTINGLARRTGYTPGALYTYFPSRDALIAELQARIFHELVALFRQAMLDFVGRASYRRSPTNIQPLARLLALPPLFEAYARQYPEKYRFLSQMLGDPVVYVAEAQALKAVVELAPLLNDIRLACVEAVAADALTPGDPTSRTTTLLAAIQGVMQTRKLLRFLDGAQELSTLLGGVAADLLAGWGARAGDLKRARRMAGAVTLPTVVTSQPKPD